MFQKTYGYHSKKRKLSYGHTSSSLNKDHMLGSKNKLKDSKLDWQKSGEGFDGLDLTKKKHSEISLINQGIPTKKSNQQGNFGICWSSSEEEGDDDNKLNMPHKDKKKKTPRKIRSKQKSTRAKRRKFESCFTMSFEPNEEDIDISDSDSELSTSDKSVQGVSPDQKAKKLNVADSVDIPDIESEDSRSESNPQPQPSHPSSPLSSSHLSPDISGASSLSQASLGQHQPSQRSKVKASEWVKSLDLKTPTKDMQSCSPPVTDDSSKKKKKYQRGGLADQLSRLLMREKSSVRMWLHQQKTSTHIQESSKTVTVKIESFEEMYSLQLSRCTVMDDISICNVMEEMTENDENLLVMFSPSNSALSDLQEGSVVTISAPCWSLLTEDGHGTVSEILLPDNAEEKFGNVLLNGESNTYTFTGLGVYNRTTRDRDEDLFSVIDKVWSGLQDFDKPSSSKTDEIQGTSTIFIQGDEITGTSAYVCERQKCFRYEQTFQNVKYRISVFINGLR
ncbi:hypothetical protein KUTeg_019609 [Tegillarca granosa]|uniref:DUF4502 domain-containing protein n=1 Tax=Tegillarca granosa TaxID=220873 RepID=A0ABQ9ED29_TEGGR|nr:hypothetical protein KUTeg_019609 [Tegillarca granosa]